MSERIDVGDRTLHAVRRGTGEPLLLIQGMSGTHASWGEPFLSDLDPVFEHVSYDHRGIGSSDPAPEPFSIVDLADDALALMDASGFEDAHVMGISMGGMVAQELALRAPDRVRSLTLGCTYSGGEGSAMASPATIQKLSAGMMSGDRDLAIRTGYEVNVSAAFASDEANWSEFYEMATGTPASIATIMLQMQAIGVHDTLERLSSISAPTLVVHGDADEMLPVANAAPDRRRDPGRAARGPRGHRSHVLVGASARVGCAGARARAGSGCRVGRRPELTGGAALVARGGSAVRQGQAAIPSRCSGRTCPSVSKARTSATCPLRRASTIRPQTTSCVRTSAPEWRQRSCAIARACVVVSSTAMVPLSAPDLRA